MKFLLMALIVGFSASAFASFNVKPGMWKIDMVIEADGKKINPSAELEKVMAALPEEQKKQMMEMLDKQGKGNMPAFGNSLSEVCLTKEMIDKGVMEGKKDEDCTYNTTTKTATHMAGSFSCKSGASGTMDWNAQSTTAYTGLINVTDKSGKKSKIDYKAKFLKDKCKG